jgi:spermidine synthase
VTAESKAPPRIGRVYAALFVASGFSAVAYQVILSRYLQLIVGGTAYATSALLVAFMLGMSAGSALGGRMADRTAHPLRLYALAEGAIGAYCLALPLLFPYLAELYLAVAPPIEGPTGPRNLVRFALGVTAFVVPSFFMGITTPAYARALAAGREDMGRRLARLYALNVLGAALGAFVTAYVLVPRLGLVGSLALGALLNAAVCLLAWRLSRPVAEAAAIEAAAGAPLAFEHRGRARRAVVLLAVAAASGFLSFALEVVWTHLLAILIGNSVYAFGLMLGSLLLGLALGARISEGYAEPEPRAATAIGLSQMLAGAAVVATLGVWDGVPGVFLLFARSSPGFALMEGVRFAVAFGLMLPPTALLGMAFPLVMRCAAAATSGFGRGLGYAYALNTLGAVAGAVLGAYWMLPALGSLGSLRLLGALLLGTGALALLLLSRHPRRFAAAAAATCVLLLGAFAPVHWDFNSLNLAAAIYLGRSASGQGHVVFTREDPTGGLTTVVEHRGVKTLLTNGKFQGDDSEEVPIQHRLANIPTLFTSGRERALVIGLGTGVTLASLAAHGFERVTCAELSLPIVEAARGHFAGVNGAVLGWPSVELLRDDGRSVLLERDDRYDVVSVEVNSIWFAGMGSIYSEEFYRLVSRRLRRNGVLLQWFPVHHLAARNLFMVVNTVRSVFPYVSVWNHRHQGFVVASNEPLAIDLESVRADLGREGLRPFLRELQSGSPLELLSDLVVTDTEADRFLDAMAELLFASRRLVSTDVWPALEYETPKDILSNFLYFQNRATFRRFRSARPFPFRGTPLPAERALADAAFLRGWSDPRASAALAELRAASPALSRAASRWLLDELTGDDVAAASLDEDALARLRQAAPALSETVEAAAPATECREAPGFVTDPLATRARLVGTVGTTLPPTRPEAALDEQAAPGWSDGWRVRPDGVPPRLELAFDRPRRLDTVHLVTRPIDGSLVRARILGREADGRWRPLAGGGQHRDLTCGEMRVYRLPETTSPLAGLAVELQGEALSHRIALYEVWALERR